MVKLTLGKKGENIAVAYLLKRGFFLVARNYRSAWGEIDIIVEKEGQIHFVEVKTRQNIDELQLGELLPEIKRRKIETTITAYLAQQTEDEISYQLDLLVVAVNAKRKVARIYFYEAV